MVSVQCMISPLSQSISKLFFELTRTSVMENSAGLDTQAGDTIVLQVPADGPYGVSLGPDETGNAAVVRGFDKLPNGKFGPIQKHGGIHYGDVLTEINDTPLASVPHAEALQMLANKNTLKKILKFQSPKVYYRKKNTMSVRSMPQDGKNSFLSAVKRSRFSDSAGKKYVEYEIACQYRLVGHKVQTEVVYQWSVWKRYSEFENLHAAVKKSLGWQMDGIDFPSAHTFVMNKLSPEFVDQRRDDLKDYWQKVIAIDKVMDFAKHHCSADIKSFLQVDENTKNKEVAPVADLLTDSVDDLALDDNNNTNAKRSAVNFGSASMSPTASGAPSRRGSVRTNSRRINTKSISLGSNALAIAETAHNPEPPAVASSLNSNPEAVPEEQESTAQKASAPAPPAPPARPTPAAAAPPPPARPSPAPTPAPAAPAAPRTAPAAGASTLPPKTAARVNLLDSIAALRKD